MFKKPRGKLSEWYTVLASLYHQGPKWCCFSPCQVLGEATAASKITYQRTKTRWKHGSWSGRSPSFWKMCVKIIINDCSRFNLGFFLRPCQRKKFDENWTHMPQRRCICEAKNEDRQAQKPKSYSVFTPLIEDHTWFPKRSTLNPDISQPVEPRTQTITEFRLDPCTVLQNMYCVARWMCIIYSLYIVYIAVPLFVCLIVFRVCISLRVHWLFFCSCTVCIFRCHLFVYSFIDVYYIRQNHGWMFVVIWVCLKIWHP